MSIKAVVQRLQGPVARSLWHPVTVWMRTVHQRSATPARTIETATESADPGPRRRRPTVAWSLPLPARANVRPGATDSLTRTMMTGSNPYASHWKGKVSGLAMPPNAVAIKEADARRLVTWILKLNKP
jgi:cytochrome c